MAEEVVHHHVDNSGSGSNLAVGILLVFLAFIVLFLLFNRGLLGFNSGNSGTSFNVPSSVDVNLKQ